MLLELHKVKMVIVVLSAIATIWLFYVKKPATRGHFRSSFVNLNRNSRHYSDKRQWDKTPVNLGCNKWLWLLVVVCGYRSSRRKMCLS